MKKFFLFFILFTISNFSQSFEYRVERLPLNNGLSHNLTYALLQDSKGFMWIGTMHGLAKYDGINYQLFRHKPKDSSSISFDDIISLYEDSEGFIWVGTWGGGLNKYDPIKETFERFIHDPKDPSSINDNIIWALTEDNSGNIWLGTETGGLSKFNKKTGTFLSINLTSDSLPQPRVQSLLSDSKNNIWIGSSIGLYLVEDQKNNPQKIEAFGNSFITDIKLKNERTLLAAYGNSIAEYQIDEGRLAAIDLSKFSEWGNTFITQIDISDDNCIWIATNNGLFTLCSDKTSLKKFINEPGNSNSLYSNNINRIFIDRGGVVWASSYNVGLNKIISAPENFLSIKLNSSFRSFVEKDNVIWMASFREGIYQLDTLNNIKQFKSSIGKENFIFTLADYDKENILVSTQDGLRLFNTKEKKLKKYKHAEYLSQLVIGSLLNNPEIIYAGTYGRGLIKIDKEKDEISRDFFDEKLNSSQTVNYILCMLKDDENLYLGTYGGLIKINSQNEISLFSHSDADPNSISHNYVFTLNNLDENNILVGTSNGLNIFEKRSGKFVSYFEEDGLPNNVINGIEKFDDKDIWISTNKGLSNFNYETKTFANYKIEDGLPANLFVPRSSFKTDDGRLIFGSHNGAVVFNPGDIYLSEYNPGVEITKVIELSEEQIINHKDGDLSFLHDINSFEIHFASLDFVNPANIKYKYYLEGFDKDWIESGNSFAVYKNLPPGDYNFKVIGTNSSGVWSSNIASLPFIIKPPFYLTWWFLTISAFAFLSLIFIIYRYNLNRKIKYAVAAEEIKSEERDKVRRKTAIDFHDELGHVLTRINLLVELVSRKIPDNDKILRPILDKISQNSFQLYNGTKDFIWSIDPQNDNLYELLIRLKDFGDELFMETDIYFEVNGISEEYKRIKLTTDWRRHLALIFKEGMTNSLKYSHSNKVILNTILANDELKIALEDDGEGFSILREHKGNGLKNMKLRAEKLNSIISINSNVGEGTKILFKGRIATGQFHLN